MGDPKDVVKTVHLETGRLCGACINLVPGEHTESVQSKDWGTLKALSLSAPSCSLCTIILSARQNWLEDCRKEKEDVDEATIDECPLELTLTSSQSHKSEVVSNTLVIFLAFGVFSYPQFFFIMGCEPEARCAALPIWKFFPTRIEQKLQQMSTWLRLCQMNHPNCRPQATELPRRLIEVGSDNGHDPRLVYSSDLTEQHPRYAALSYCWGSALPVCTLKATEPNFRRRLPYHTLPQTLKDSIHIARALRIPYIWIDALCIVQDDLEDWEREAARMQEIYSGSTLTIAASGAKDTSEGFFAHEPPRFQSAAVALERSYFTLANSAAGKRMTFQVQHYGSCNTGMAPILHTRGWTLQESVLSNRIVQCVRSELYWRCNQSCETESGVSYSPTAAVSWNVPVLDLKDESGAHRLWWKLIEDYTGRSFTFRKDRLPAIAGLINYFQEKTNDSPCLGLWNRSLSQDLTWIRTGQLQREQGPSELDFPSWTWLSCPVSITFEPTASNAPPELREVPKTTTNHAKVVDWQVLWHDHEFTSKLKSTRLVVEGPVQELFIDIPTEAKNFKPPYCIIDSKMPEGSKSPIPWRSTVQFDGEEWRPANTWTCLLLQSNTYSQGEGKRRDDTFLLMESVSSGPGLNMYRRVGLGISRDDENVFGAAVRRSLQLV